MCIPIHRPVFQREPLDGSSDLAAICQFFALLEDGPLLNALAKARGRGRSDSPVHVLWLCALHQPLSRHPTLQQTLR